MPIFLSGKFIETEKHCNSLISLIARLSARKSDMTICLQIDGCLSGLGQRMHEARSQKPCFFFSKNVARDMHDDHRNLSILCPIYAQYKGDAVSHVLNITLTKRRWLLSIIFVNRNAITHIDIKTRRLQKLCFFFSKRCS